MKCVIRGLWGSFACQKPAKEQATGLSIRFAVPFEDPAQGTLLRRLSLWSALAAIGLLLVIASSQTGLAQSTPALNFENNFFVTGDYVVAGWANKQPDANRSGYAIGTISVPDNFQISKITVPQAGVPTQVPTGADIVAAYLYWTTVEKDKSTFAGQNAFFRGYAISGVVLGNPNAPVSWSSGGCSGSSNGTTTMRAYRSEVRAYLPVNSNGIVQPNTSYTVEFRDSGSNGNGTPFTLGATLVLIYRVLSPNIPLNAIVLYDGAFSPSNTTSAMTQTLQGFYQPATTSPLAKLTHIVANGQAKKLETVSLNSTPLLSLYGNSSSFPGIYNGDWDNPTWNVSAALAPPPNDPTNTTSVVPNSSNKGCVSWGTIVFSTTVQDTDADGLLDYWEQAPPNPVNPNPPGTSPGYVDVGTGDFVALPGANPNQKDIFVQLDYMCSDVIMNPDYSSTCDPSGVSFLPPAGTLPNVATAFTSNGHNVNVHYDVKNAIPEQTCTDTDTTDSCLNPVYTPYPNQPGVVGWKGGFSFLKNQPLNYPDEASCETRTPSGGPAGSGPPCIRRFQHGRKDSYHYAMFANAMGVPNWNFVSGTLTGVSASGTSVTFTTSTDHGLIVDPSAGDGRVTISDAITNPSLNGTYLVQSIPTSSSFTIQIASPTSATYSLSTDPNLSVASGEADSTSGASDVGGQDSLIALGDLWGADGQTVNVQSGTFMHELGHTLTLTHGGLYYDTAGSFVPTAEANCKANFQSVMNYLFQVDLLDNGVLDYSEQRVIPLNEQTVGGVTGLTSADPSGNTFYSTTKWYSPTAPFGVGTAATVHCDGTPKLSTDPTMFRVEGVTNHITPAWANNQDINFNGNIDSSLRGYNDWTHVDLRQIGASGSLSTAGFGGGGFALGGGGFALGGGGFALGGGGFALGGGGFALGGGGFALGGGGFALGQGHGEVNHTTANSVTRPPRSLTATVLSSPSRIQLSWTTPTFGQIGAYKIYRGVDGATPAPPAYATVTGTPAATTFTDTSISCGHNYAYFVTAVLAGTTQESVPSNLVAVNKCVVGP